MKQISNFIFTRKHVEVKIACDYDIGDVCVRRTINTLQNQVEVVRITPNHPNYYFQGSRKENITMCQLRNSKSQLNQDLSNDHIKESPNCHLCDVPETIDHFILECPNHATERTNLINSLIMKPNIYSKITICVNNLLFGNPELSYEEKCQLIELVMLFINQTNRL